MINIYIVYYLICSAGIGMVIYRIIVEIKPFLYQSTPSTNVASEVQTVEQFAVQIDEIDVIPDTNKEISTSNINRKEYDDTLMRLAYEAYMRGYVNGKQSKSDRHLHKWQVIAKQSRQDPIVKWLDRTNVTMKDINTFHRAFSNAHLSLKSETKDWLQGIHHGVPKGDHKPRKQQ